jgi:hypothetical protein
MELQHFFPGPFLLLSLYGAVWKVKVKFPARPLPARSFAPDVIVTV